MLEMAAYRKNMSEKKLELIRNYNKNFYRGGLCVEVCGKGEGRR
jgi:hypothetical protein